jgi:hypothetical protein
MHFVQHWKRKQGRLAAGVLLLLSGPALLLAGLDTCLPVHHTSDEGGHV